MSFSSLVAAVRRRGPGGLLRPVLLSTTLLDELTIGFLVVTLPLARETLHLTYFQAGLLFTIGQIASLVIEPPILLLSDRAGKRLPVLLGMIGLVVGYVIASASTSFVQLLLAIIVIFPATGGAVGLAQAALIDTSPGQAAATMARWTLLSGVGDLLAPLGVAALTVSNQGWRTMCLLAAGVWLIAALATVPQRFPPPSATPDEDDEGAPTGNVFVRLRTSLRIAFSNGRLVRWMVVLFMADMVDEVFLGFAGLLLHDRLHASETVVSLVLGAQMLGGLLALVLLDRLLARGRVRGGRLLPWLGLATLVGIVLLLLAPGVMVAAVGLVIVGAGAAGWYPIAKAAAYGLFPGRTGTALAVLSLSVPAELVLPALVGIVAQQFGLLAGIGLLGLAPLGVLLAAPKRDMPA